MITSRLTAVQRSQSPPGGQNVVADGNVQRHGRIIVSRIACPDIADAYVAICNTKDVQ